MTISTTPKFALPWPENDEPVTNGWDAIRDLAVALDAALDDLPKGEIARVEVTAGDLGPYTVEAKPVPGMTFNAPVVAGRKYRLTAQGTIQMQTANGRAQMRLYKGSTGAEHIQTVLKDMSTNAFDGFELTRTWTAPTTQVETFQLSAQSTAGSTVWLSIAAWQTTQLVLEDLGLA